jgi:hypothetical protein
MPPFIIPYFLKARRAYIEHEGKKRQEGKVNGEMSF